MSKVAVLDDVSKAIIEQLQQDGRRPYATIGKAVGLSEAELCKSLPLRIHFKLVLIAKR